MDMIIRHIEYLVQKRKQVALSGLGTVTVCHMPAYFSSSSGISYPPGYTFLFSFETDPDDKALRDSIMRREGYSAMQAEEAISTAAETARQLLECGEEVSLGKIGILKADRNQGGVFFTPGDAKTVICDTIWLPEVKLRENKQTGTIPLASSQSSELIIEDPIEEVSEEPAIERGRWLTRLLKGGKYVAVIALVLAVAVALFRPEYKPASNGFKASLGLMELISRGDAMPSSDEESIKAGTLSPNTMIIVLGGHSDGRELKADEVDTPIVNQTNRELGLNKKSRIEADKKTASATGNSDNSCLGNRSGRYCMIVASLNSREEARRYISERGDENLDIVQSGDKWRVYAASSDSKAAIERMCLQPDISSSYPGAWVARR